MVKLMSDMWKGKTLKRVNLTRWLAREDAYKSVRDSLHEVFVTSESLKDDVPERFYLEKKWREYFWIERTVNGSNVCCVKGFLGKNQVNVLQIQNCPVEQDNFKYFEEEAMAWNVSKQYTTEIGKRQPKRKMIW